MEEEDRLRAELKETRQLLELARQQLRLTTAIIRELRGQHIHKIKVSPKIVKKWKIISDYYRSRHLTTAEFVTDNKAEIRRDIISRIEDFTNQSHLWTTEREERAFQYLFEEYCSILDIIKDLPPDPSEHL